MILFLNFAPLTFGGGAERWIVSVAEELATDEKVIVLSVNKKISDLYAQLVLKRKFDQRLSLKNKKFDHIFISPEAFNPFSAESKKIRQLFQEARVIYAKFEVNESLISWYFAGNWVWNKMIFGLHSPFVYKHENLTFFESLHNAVYRSNFSKQILKKSHRVHALNSEQVTVLKNDFTLNNIECVPNFIEKKPSFTKTSNPKVLLISFIGELSIRKGADILLEVIKNSPVHFVFRIAGDGELKEEFQKLERANVEYSGYVNRSTVQSILADSDVLFMPSYAESFSLACLEALSYGLAVVCSKSITLSTIKKYLYVSSSTDSESYIQILDSLYKKKKSNALNVARKKTWQEVNETFSKKRIVTELKQHVFGTLRA